MFSSRDEMLEDMDMKESYSDEQRTRSKKWMTNKLLPSTHMFGLSRIIAWKITTPSHLKKLSGTMSALLAL
jgi:hypothetical protein